MINPEIWKHFDCVIAVDPGLSTGNGIICLSHKGVFDWSALKNDSSAGSFENRLSLHLHCLEDIYDNFVHDFMVESIDVEPVCLFAIENCFVGAGGNGALKQSELIGVQAMCAHRYMLPVVRVQPTQTKKALTGRGKAKKDEDMVPHAIKLYPSVAEIKYKYQREAVADAIGVAIAGADKWLKENTDG